ncbi:hypothetical protein TNCV_182591 [Trichonephila clavipes]|nr:hypothetical protein TNCV_182591 [Trichonephila clavipes]
MAAYSGYVKSGRYTIITSNFTCELMAIKEALDNYHSRAIVSFNDNLLFSDLKPALQAILRCNSQLTQDIIPIINKVVATQRPFTLQYIMAKIDILGQWQARNSPQLFHTLTDGVVIARRKLIIQLENT